MTAMGRIQTLPVTPSHLAIASSPDCSFALHVTIGLKVCCERINVTCLVIQRYVMACFFSVVTVTSGCAANRYPSRLA